MKQLKPAIALTVLIVLSLVLTARKAATPRVLVFSATKGFRHASIGPGKLAVMKLGRENGFIVDTTENSADITEENLKKYSAVIFLNTTGDVLNAAQQADFERYIQAGGGFVGVHAASDCEYTWPWYGKLVGAYFKSHPATQQARVIIVDKNHPSTSHLPDTWDRTDEWYNFQVVPADKDVKILARLDESSYKGGENGDIHPIAWYHAYDGGRAFYSGFGHTDETFADPLYQKHILGGIMYAIGNNEPLDYTKARSMRVPEEDRFSKNVLATGFDEPTEMAILPGLDVLVVQRKGEVMYYNAAQNKLTQVARLNVYSKAKVPGVNAEEGVLGLAADPNYKSNKYIYIFYSPADTSVNRLSRFVFSNGTLNLASEKIILQFYSQRNICCHTGGSIAFGPDGSLFLSAGDNSTPFDQPSSKYKLNGFAPMDERPGFEQWDARRSSSNTNDLRGKILRIKVADDGSYTIPEGNLFPPGTEKARPEIYVMGNRNPYRISVDRKTGFLYWGEVGNDASNDSMQRRGPRGYDELNQARKAGYFGWPLFVGNNYPYRRFDYATGQHGDAYDPAKPVNESRNNTGLRELPPVSPAFIWYPYAASPDFPEVGTGGRNAMAGPVYYPEFYPKETRLPDYYAGKLFFYDWIRGWIKPVTMKPNGDYDHMENFMAGTKFNSIIDMEMGPDGRIYLLEYGTGWFTKNQDAALSRIEFNAGNRPPKAVISVYKMTGALPFTVQVSAEGSVDPDKDPVTYIWHYGKNVKQTKEPKTSFTLAVAGDYPVYVEVKDSKGAIGKSQTQTVYAGNETPEVNIDLSGNPPFVFPGQPVKYKVTVKDKEDGTKVDPSRLYVKVDYISGMDKAQVVGHQQVSAAMEGKAIVENSDCRTCHKVNEKSIGPSFTQVANKYANDGKATQYLSNKIIKGGSGVWGEVAMAAHPDLKQADVQKIVTYILSLSKSTAVKTLPQQGSITPAEKDLSGGKVMQISASYTDKGGPKIKPLTGYNSAVLRSPQLGVHENTALNNMTIVEFGGNKYGILGEGAVGWLEFGQMNLSPVKHVDISYAMQQPLDKGYQVELRADASDGPVLGTADIPAGGKAGFNVVRMPVEFTGDRSRKIFVVVRRREGESNTAALSNLKFLIK
jgi:glucose/arabinose dehydrogenase/cytochrome c551/c552/type 1 glutamine amidotransferase